MIKRILQREVSHHRHELRLCRKSPEEYQMARSRDRQLRSLRRHRSISVIVFTPTYRCNLSCRYCDRFSNHHGEFDDTDMTLEQTHARIDDLLEVGVRIRRFKISGGEPMLNPQIYEICEAIRSRLDPLCQSYRFQTNSTFEVDYSRMKGWTVRHSPVRMKFHYPIAWSPADFGLYRRPLTYCMAASRCGRNADYLGWSMCNRATVLAKMLKMESTHVGCELPVLDFDDDLCQHCPYGMSQKTQADVLDKIGKKELPCPSPTYEKVMHRPELHNSLRPLHDPMGPKRIAYMVQAQDMVQLDLPDKV